jgi:hypothetical protein
LLAATAALVLSGCGREAESARKAAGPPPVPITSGQLTLVVVPAACALVENWRERRRAQRHAPVPQQQQGPA